MMNRKLSRAVFRNTYGISLNDGAGVRGNTRPQVSALLSDGAGDGRSLHLTLGVDNDSGVVLKVQDDTLPAAPRLALADHNRGHNLFSQLRLSVLDRAENHISDTSLGHPVEATRGVGNSDDVQVLGASVVGAVDQSRDG